MVRVFASGTASVRLKKTSQELQLDQLSAIDFVDGWHIIIPGGCAKPGTSQSWIAVESYRQLSAVSRTFPKQPHLLLASPAWSQEISPMSAFGSKSGSALAQNTSQHDSVGIPFTCRTMPVWRCSVCQRGLQEQETILSVISPHSPPL
jgi:hypothetical protein